ncbi:hypothetical protein Tco_1377771 [Tanacetum coccineum]
MITNNNKTRGRTLAGPTLQDLVRRNLTEDLNLCIQNATITTMVHVLPNATSAIELAIWPATVEVLQILMLVTIRGALGQLAKNQVIIVCAEKIVRIPWGNETLIVRGDRSDRGNNTRLNIISCTKTRKYMLKGCHVFLAHVTTKDTEDKLEKKRLEDVPIVQNFPEDLSGLPPTRQVKFQIYLIPGAAPVGRAPYRLAPSKIKELSDQLQELSNKCFIRPSFSPWGASVLFVKKKDGSF